MLNGDEPLKTDRSSDNHRSSSHNGSRHHRSAGTSAGGRRSSQQSAYNNHRKASSKGHHSGDELLDREEVIQVEILPQDDNWGESTTCVTGNTSERSASYDDIRRALKENSSAFVWNNDESNSFFRRMRCARYCAVFIAAAVCFTAFFSPVAMVVLPKIHIVLPSSHAAFRQSNSSSFSSSSIFWSTSICTPDCEGLLISFSIKLLILLIGIWALFVRRFTETLPRLYISKWLILSLIFLITFAYWLFYGVRIMQKREQNYTTVVTFALSLVDTLLFVHYLAVITLEIRGLRSEFRIRIVRSPDGESKTFDCGALSIQRAAVFVLRNYYRDFNVYNPYLERLPTSSAGRLRKNGGSNSGAQPLASYKVYDLDDRGGAGSVSSGGVSSAMMPSADATQAIMAAAARKRDAGHNEKFYEEIEWERRVKKRKARLVTAAEEAFGHVKRLHEEKGPCVPMDAHEAAQAVFPSLARSLQKYLRITRQQPRHTAEQVIRHLAQCLTFDVSPKAFLERFFSNKETHEATQIKTKWSIVCDSLVSRNIRHGLLFQLRCHCPGPDAGVYLLCTVSRLPFFDLTEETFDPKRDKFVLRLNSETSV